MYVYIYTHKYICIYLRESREEETLLLSPFLSDAGLCFSGILALLLTIYIVSIYIYYIYIYIPHEPKAILSVLYEHTHTNTQLFRFSNASHLVGVIVSENSS